MVGKKNQIQVIQVVSGLQCDGIPSDSLLGKSGHTSTQQGFIWRKISSIFQIIKRGKISVDKVLINTT